MNQGFKTDTPGLALARRVARFFVIGRRGTSRLVWDDVGCLDQGSALTARFDQNPLIEHTGLEAWALCHPAGKFALDSHSPDQPSTTKLIRN